MIAWLCHLILNILPFKPEIDDVINDVIFTACIKNTLSRNLAWWAKSRWLTHVWYWNWKQSVYRPFMMTSLILPDMLQTNKDLYFLRLTVYHSGIWHLGTYFVAYSSHCIKKGKDASWTSQWWRHQFESNDKKIHSVLIYKYCGLLLLKFGILGSFKLLMTDKYKFVSKSKIRL